MLVGCVFIVAGVVLVVFHKKVKEINDWSNKHDPLLKWGDWWTGEYTRGGLIFTHLFIILLGLVISIFGLLIVTNVVD